MTASFRRVAVIGGVAVVIAAGVATWQYLRARQSGDRLVVSGVVEADEILVGSRVSGRIAAVLVEEGSRVGPGQPLVRFEEHDLIARRAEAAASVEEAEEGLRKLLNGSRPEEIAEARAQAEAARMSLEVARTGPRPQEIDAGRAELKAAEADLELAMISHQRISSLASQGVVSRQEMDAAKSDFERARARRDAARERLALLEAGTRIEEIERAERLYNEALARKELVERGPRKEDIAAARARLESARAMLQVVETQVAELQVTAPADSFVEVLRVRPGDLIVPNAPIATLIEAGRLWVQVYVPAPELGYLRLGKEVTIFVDTFPNEGFAGRIEHIASQGEFTPRNVQTREERSNQVFAVRVQVLSGADRIRPGMAAEVRIMKDKDERGPAIAD